MGKQHDGGGTSSSASKKTPVIEDLFNLRWNAAQSSLANSVVSLEDVVVAIEKHNRTATATKLSTKNPANFFKDFIRRRDSANKHWPKSVFTRGYTAVQRTGGKACFEFVRLAAEQTEPFPDRLPLPADLQRFKIESLSLPLASRRLGRRDETWLTQVLVRLRVLETHLAVVSGRPVIQLRHLQMGIKSGQTEIDALFLAIEQTGDREPRHLREVMVCCEAKGFHDDILPDQVLEQVKAVFKMNVEQDLILPMAAKIIGKSLVRVVEFDGVSREDAATLSSLSLVSEATYEFVPPVPAIGD